MEFGNCDRFGISVALEEISGEGWLLGHFFYWIGGQQVGNYDDIAMLGDILTASTWICYDNRHGRPGDCFYGMSDQDIFHVIYSYLYDTLNPPVKSLPEDLMPARFQALPLDNIFDGCRVFMFSNDEHSTILFRNGEEGGLNKVILENREFEKIFSEAYDYILALENSSLQPE